MRKLFSNTALVAIAAGGMLFSSCSDRDMFNPNYKMDQYAANWETKFGKIDPAQDWNMATSVTATVSVAHEGNFTVKIYSSDPKDESQQAYLLAKTAMTGGTPVTITFDAVKGLDNVFVALINEHNYGVIKKVAVENGTAAIDFSAAGGNRANTRTAAQFDWELTDYKYFNHDDIAEIVESLPEGQDAENAENNYEFVSNGEFVIYPVYGETWGVDEIGYYYYDPSVESVYARREVTLIKNLHELGDNVQYVTSEYSLQEGNWNLTNTTYSDYSFKPGGTKQLNTKVDGDRKEEYEVRAKGYAINVPAGYHVGFWIKQSEEKKFYSNKLLNKDGSYYSAVVQHSNGTMFFGMEDWLREEAIAYGDNSDCNDVVFYVKTLDNNDEKIPDTVNPDETPDESKDVVMSWILACEDLGDTDDYDFNDIVLEVQRVDKVTEAGESHKVQVRCLAAGGTLPAHIYYNDIEIGESHAMFGAPTNQMINTKGFGKASDWITVEENVTKDWTLNASNFRIEVDQNDVTQSSVTIAAPEAGKAPQMIVVPGGWEWPSERTKIQDAYPDFVNWNANASLVDWNNTKENDLVIKH